MEFFFFFQAEDGIRDYKVTGVQTCALPISGEQLLGTHDFLAFGDVPGGRESSVRRLDQAEARRDGETVTVDLRATAFLKHMARSISGTLLRAGTGAITAAETGRILRDRDRHA